ncbi:MAG: hypothetical protein WCF77_00270 [Minisyncoccia bacterium]|jgi:hypothetical protein
MKKVLVVEGERYWYYIWRRALDGKVTLLGATSAAGTEKQLAENSDIAVIVVGMCEPLDISLLPFVRKLRSVFMGPMIGVSAEPDYQRRLRDAGCDHASTKRSMPGKLMEVLGP